MPRFWRLPLGVAVLALFVIVPVTKNVHLVYTANEALAVAIIFLGLSLLVRTSGQVSLCQLGFAAVGACAFAHLAASFGVPWLVALLIGGVAAAAVGAVVAIPAIRVAGIYLAIATFGFGVLLEQLVYPTAYLFGQGQTVATRPVIGSIDGSDNVTFFVIIALIFGVALAAVVGVRRARLGRLLRALGDSPVALEAQGTTINVTKVAVFSLSAFLAGIGGALLVSQLTFLESGPFTSMGSLTIVAILLTLRVADPFSSLVAAAAYVVVPSFISDRAAVWWLDILFGGGAVVAALASGTSWLPRWQWRSPRRRQETWLPDPAGRVSSSLATSVSEAADLSGVRPGRTGLEVLDLQVRYRGLLAVDGLSLAVPTGHITGLIGPNGAGKTTTFNACSGLVRPSQGRVILHGHDITDLGPAARARRGLGRTFQRVDLFDSLTVGENIELGAEGALAGARFLRHLVASPPQRHRTRLAAAEALETVGIGRLTHRQVGTLSTGEKRLVELARCLAGTFDVLLLDEPSSGLDAVETDAFAGVLERVTSDRGLGILLVEHNISLVTQVCSRLYVLDFGRLIFEGGPTDALGDPDVRSAYLGTTAGRNGILRMAGPKRA